LTAYVVDGVKSLLISADVGTQTQEASTAIGLSPSSVTVTPDGSEAWVTTLTGLEIVNTATGKVSGPVILPGTPTAVVFGR
jgi:DNA-binding beta-propeller fold protein YncE